MDEVRVLVLIDPAVIPTDRVVIDDEIVIIHGAQRDRGLVEDILRRCSIFLFDNQLTFAQM